MERKEIAKITFDISPDDIKKVVSSGKLEEFVSKAVETFRVSLKAELVRNTASIKSSLILIDDDEFGTGPFPPHWWDVLRVDQLESRLVQLELALKIGR
jgi:hypothetical protein